MGPLQEQAELSEQLAMPEANRLIGPKAITSAKQLLLRELEKQGIYREVRTFAELVQDVKDENWRMVIETFLGKKRHHIIVDGKYCHQALEILHDNKIQTATLVLTDKLPDTQAVPESAAGQLVRKNCLNWSVHS